MPLTGPVAEPGNNCLNGVILAYEEIQDSIRKNIKLIVEDSKSEPTVGVNAFNKLINADNVKIVIGDIMSSVMLAIAPIAELSKVVVLSPGASNPKLSTAGEYIFRNIASDDYDGNVMAHYIYNNLRFNNVAVIYVNNDYGLGVANVFSKEFTALGGEIVLKDNYSQGQRNFRTLAVRIKNSSADCIYIIGNPQENGYLVKQLYEIGNKKPIVGNLSFENQEFINIAKGAFNNIKFSAPYFDLNSNDTTVVSFINRYKMKYKREPDVAAALGYDAFNIILEALQNDKYKTESLKKALYKIKNYNGVTGKTSFDKNGDAKKSIFIKTINYDGAISIQEKYD